MVEIYSPSNGQDTMKSSPDGSSAQGLQGVQCSTLASSAGAGAAQVDIVRVPEQEAEEGVLASPGLESTAEQGLKGDTRADLLQDEPPSRRPSDDTVNSHRKCSSGQWVDSEADVPHRTASEDMVEDMPTNRTANEELLDDFLQSTREKALLAEVQARRTSSMANAAPVTQTQFERKAMLERRTYSGMLLVGVKAKIVNREPLAFSDTQDRSVTWFFGGFSKESRFRQQCYKLYTNHTWKVLNLVLIIMNCAAVAILPGLDDVQTIGGGTWTQHDWWKLFDLICLFFLGLEILVGIIALGLFSSNTSWFNCVEYHRLDLFVFVLASLENVATAFGLRTITIIPFRLLRIFHVLTSAKALSGVRVMLQTLLQGSSQLITVFATFLATTATFAIVGMAMFQRSFRRRCVLIDDLPPPWVPTNTSLWGQGVIVAEEDVITGGYPFFEACKIMYNSTAGTFDGSYPLDPYGRYHTCQLGAFGRGEPVNHTCEDVGNPEASFGFASFDHLGHAMLVLFQSSLPDAFNLVLHVSLQAEPGTAWLTWLYYFVITGISTCLMLGLFVAVVTGTFKRVREESEYREAQLRNLKLHKHSMKLPHSIREPGLVIAPDSPKQDAPTATRTRSEGSLASVGSGVSIAKPDEDASTLDDARPSSGGPDGQELDSMLARVDSALERERTDMTLYASNVVSVHSDAELGCGQLDAADVASTPEQRLRRFVSNSLDSTWKLTVSRWTKIPVYALNGILYVAVIAHAATLASDQYNSSAEWKSVAAVLYIVCSIVYAIEVGFHAAAMHAHDPRSVLRSRKLWFKAVLCLLGIVGWAANIEWLKRTQAIWMYKIMRLMPTLELLVSLTVASLEHVFSVCLFVCIWMMVYAVTGRYVFGDDMDAITRSNFGTMGRAALTVFQLFTGDSWSSVMYSALDSGDDALHWIIAALFILSWVILSQFLLNNLFIAVIIDKFKVSEVISEQIRLNQEQSLLTWTRAHANSFWNKLYRRPNWSVKSPKHPGQAEVDALVRSFESRGIRSGRVVPDPSTPIRGSPLSPGDNGGSPMKSTASPMKSTAKALRSGEDGALVHEVSRLSRGSQSSEGRLRAAMMAGTQQQSSVALFNQLIDYNTTSQMMSVVETANLSAHLSSRRGEHEEAPEQVLFLFGRENPARRFCVWLGTMKLFDSAVILAIICSCLLLTITPKHDDIPGWEHVMSPAAIRSCSLGFTLLFTLEFVVRVMHQGLLLTPRAYLKNGWNQADLLILAFAWIDETDYMHGNGVSKVFRLGRAFRPLRLMKRNKGMRVLVDALLHAMIPVSYVFLFSVFTSVVFGLVGMGLFGGKFYSCSAPGAAYPGGKLECVGFSVQDETGMLMPRSWVNDYHNFDTIWDACTTLLQVATLKYVGVMYRAMDVTAVDQSPREDATEASSLFFVAFIVCGRLFVYNLFVAFIVDGFYASRGSSQSSIAFGRLMRQLKIHKPPREDYKMWTNRLSKWLLRVVQHPYFQTCSIVCVFANVLIMLGDHADPSPTFADFMWWQNLVFFGELCAEVLLQIIAYGPAAFAQDKWRLFDLAVAGGTALGYISSQREIANFAKSFRLARALRFMTLIRSVRIIFETLIACLPQLFNIFLLVVLVYSIFAAVAVQLFGVTKYGRRLGPTANFDTWGQAMQTCYQMLTGDDWMDLRSDCEVQYPYCTPTFDSANVFGWEGEDLSFGDCGTDTAYLYFIAFKIFCEAVLLNLVIGMALDNFSFVTDDVSHEEDATWSQGASSDQVRQLAVEFRKLDAGTGAIPLSFLPSLMHQLPRPMGFRDTVLSPTAKGQNNINNQNNNKNRLSPLNLQQQQFLQRGGRASPRKSISAISEGSAQHSAHQRLMNPQVSTDKEMLRNVRAELNCLVRDRRLAHKSRHVRWEVWAGAGRVRAGAQWASKWLGWKQRFKEAVTFEEVMRTIVLWQLPNLVPDEVHAWRQRWVMDDIMAMTRILAVRDWLVLRHRHKRKAREAREKLQLAAERERDHEQQQLELTKLAAPMRLESTQDRDSASEQVQSGKGSMPATVASQTDTPRRAGGASRTGSEEEPEK